MREELDDGLVFEKVRVRGRREVRSGDATVKSRGRWSVRRNTSLDSAFALFYILESHIAYHFASMQTNQLHGTDDNEVIRAAFERLSLQPAQAVPILATASRSEPSIRSQLADPSVLKILIDLVETSIDNSLDVTSTALRCIGNACIDNPSARDNITSLGFSWAKRMLQPSSDSDVRLLALKVLYNICTDHKGSQEACYRERLHYDLWRTRPLFQDANEDDLLCLTDLLFWITEHKSELEPTLNEAPPLDVLLDALALPSDTKFTTSTEDFTAQLESTLSLLRDPTVQTTLLQTHNFQPVLTLLYTTEQKLSSSSDPDETKLLLASWTSLLWCTSDLAANPLMAQTYPLDSTELNALVNSILQYSQNASMHPRLPTAACQAIGNILWNLSPEQTESFVERRLEGDVRLDGALFKTLVEKDDVEYLHAAAGLLVLLSRASVASRERMGCDGHARTALERLCAHAMAEVKKDGVALLKALGRESSVNQGRFGDIAAAVMAVQEAQGAAEVGTPG